MKIISKYLKIAITVIVVFFFIFYFSTNQKDLSSVLAIPPWYLFAIFISFSAAMYLNGEFIRATVSRFGNKVPVLEAFYISVLSSLGNYFLPLRGGAALRSVYLKKYFNIPYSYFVSTLYGYYVLVFLVNSFVGSVVLSIFYVKFSVNSKPLFIFFIVSTVLMGFLTLFQYDPGKYRKSQSHDFPNKLINLLLRILEGWHTIRKEKSLLKALILINFGIFLCTSLTYFFEFRALGIDVGIYNILLYSCLSALTLLISITPGSLGIREAVFVFTSQTLQISPNQVMQLSLLDRSLTMITLGILYALLFFLTQHRISRKALLN